MIHDRCDADPGALAKYVIALVKKDKPMEQLKESCLDQLDVFLQKGQPNARRTINESNKIQSL